MFIFDGEAVYLLSHYTTVSARDGLADPHLDKLGQRAAGRLDSHLADVGARLEPELDKELLVGHRLGSEVNGRVVRAGNDALGHKNHVLGRQLSLDGTNVGGWQV